MTAERDQWNRDRIVAAQHGEAGRHLMNHLRHLANVAGRFLDPDDVIDFREPTQRGRLDVHPGTALYARNDQWQLYRRCDRLVVLVQAFLRGLVVVWRD